jgi:hypothetical protein
MQETTRNQELHKSHLDEKKQRMYAAIIPLFFQVPLILWPKTPNFSWFMVLLLTKSTTPKRLLNTHKL